MTLINDLKPIFTDKWVTKDKILSYLETNGIYVKERALRREFELFNKTYADNGELFVAHSNKGYMLTSDKETIAKSINDDYNRALKLMKRYHATYKSIGTKNWLNLGLNQTQEDTFELLEKVLN